MVKLSTQPVNGPAPVQLRSGFWALPFASGKNWLYAREHQPLQDGDDHQGDQQEPHLESQDGANEPRLHRLFVTGLPFNLTAVDNDKHIRNIFNKIVFASNPSLKCTHVELLPASNFDSSTLLARELATTKAAAAAAVASTSTDVPALFTPTQTSWPPSTSALLTFSSRPTLPPPTYSTQSALPTPSSNSTSALLRSKASHTLARPHRSTVIAHSDAWMRAFDSRQRAMKAAAHGNASYVAQPGSATAAQSATQRKKQRKLLQQQQQQQGAQLVGPDGQPAKGSAAAALAAFNAAQTKRSDPSFNPDDPEADEEGWTLVSRGGRHGKSLLPDDVRATVEGYGGRNVKVAKRERQGRDRDRDSDADSADSADEADGNNINQLKYQQGIRKIVGSGFYRHTKDMERRKDLTDLKARFEEDKARVDRFRGGNGSSSRGQGQNRGRGRGRDGNSRGGGSSGRGRGAGSSGAGRGKASRAYKPY